jgi:hypothetical protein
MIDRVIIRLQMFEDVVVMICSSLKSFISDTLLNLLHLGWLMPYLYLEDNIYTLAYHDSKANDFIALVTYIIFILLAVMQKIVKKSFEES